MATNYLGDFSDDAFEELTGKGIKTGPNDSIPALEEHNHFKPVFGFDYISFKRSDFCFNNPKIPARDFIELLRRCSSISQLSYGELQDATLGNGYHFHEVDKARLTEHGLVSMFRERVPDRKKSLPPVYQFAIYTDRDTAPRVLGYVGKWGIFYLLWFDWEHLLYPRDVSPPVATSPAALPPPAEAITLRADGKPRRPRLLPPDS